jgi:hypothetical protein
MSAASSADACRLTPIAGPRRWTGCAAIRSDIAGNRQETNALREARDGLDPRNPEDGIEIREMNSQIADLERQIAALQQRSIELGCG